MNTENRVIKHPDLLTNSWYNLKEACRIKGIKYKTVLNAPWRKPNCGKKYDAILNGQKMYSRETIDDWLGKDDPAMMRQFEEMQGETNG